MGVRRLGKSQYQAGYDNTSAYLDIYSQHQPTVSTFQSMEMLQKEKLHIDVTLESNFCKW